ncbi:MAG: M48 family metalloprotease [Armatimonadetes bacterium]|nr:M48 family metalloprotease [Armatimonadota bacterium]
MSERIHLTGISPDAFVSDADKWALDKLKKLPLVPQLVAKFYEIGIDRWMYCYNMSSSIRCGPNQYPTLYNIMKESCKVMDMPEPELYVSNNPFPNAFAGGVERPYITLRSSMIDTMSNEELFFIMGHELGHIKADHVLYRSVGYLLFPLLELLGRRSMGASDIATYALYLAFFEWSRQAEFSCDRAGLLVGQDTRLASRSLIKLAAGPSRLADELNEEAFMEQARAYQDADSLDKLGKIVLFATFGKTLTHPMPVHRTQELERWIQSGAYERILSGEYAKVA